MLAAAILLRSSTPLAQRAQVDPVVAEALFRAGRELVLAGNYAEGCPKFEASLELEPSASTMLNIAKCREHEGKLATAWADYHRALVLNRETKGEERRKALEEVARQGISALAPRLPRLRILVPNPPAGITVRRDGKELPATTLGEALPADPGQHEVSVSAPGHRSETRSVLLEEGKTATVDISLQFVIATDAGVPRATPRSGDAAPDAARRSAGGGSLLPAGIAFGVGAIGLGVGVVTGAISLSRLDDIKSRCVDNHCLASDEAQASSAITLGHVSTAAFIVGGAGAAAGAVLLMLRTDEGPTASAAQEGRRGAGWTAGVGLGQVELKGRF